MTLLAVDIGNSRVKWGVHDGLRWVRTGAMDHADVAALGGAPGTDLPEGTEVIGVSVGSHALTAQVAELIEARGLAPRWIESRAEQCGVTNLYDPAQLGPDRWAALIAARHLYPGACVVVTAGTAMTVDALSVSGEFLGGVIVPGVSLMYRALARDTAGLGLYEGRFQRFPRTTADAIATGVILALSGTVEQMAGHLHAAGAEDINVIASGGAIGALRPYLPADTIVVDNLVLEGLLVIARES